MHELALMTNVLDAVRESARQMNIARVNRLKLVVGKLTMALPDSLQFAFEVLSQDDLFRGAVLEIEEKDMQCECAHCQHLFKVENGYRFVCPRCGENGAVIVAGRELYIDYYEGE